MWLNTLLYFDMFCNLIASLSVSLLGSSQWGRSWARCTAQVGAVHSKLAALSYPWLKPRDTPRSRMKMQENYATSKKLWEQQNSVHNKIANSEHSKTQNPSQKLDPRRGKQFRAKLVHPQPKYTKTHHRFGSSLVHTRSFVFGTTRESRHGFEFGKNNPSTDRKQMGGKATPQCNQ